jgi:hypothetical protein
MEQGYNKRFLHLDKFRHISTRLLMDLGQKEGTDLLTFPRLRQSPIEPLVVSVREVQDGLLDLLPRPHSRKREEERSRFGTEEYPNQNAETGG